MIQKFSAFKAGLFLFLCLLTTQGNAAFYFDFQPRVACYLPTNGSGKKLFSYAAWMYQIEVSGHFAESWNDIPWKYWVNISWIPQTGRLRNSWRSDTNFIPLSAGLKHSWCLTSNIDFYVGLGAVGSYTRIKAETHRFERRIHKNTWGAVIKSGLRFVFCDWILFDLFSDYYILSFAYRKSFHDAELKHDRQLRRERGDAPLQVTWFQHADGTWHHDGEGRSRREKHRRHHEVKGHHKLNLNGFALGGAVGISF